MLSTKLVGGIMLATAPVAAGSASARVWDISAITIALLVILALVMVGGAYFGVTPSEIRGHEVPKGKGAMGLIGALALVMLIAFLGQYLISPDGASSPMKDAFFNSSLTNVHHAKAGMKEMGAAALNKAKNLTGWNSKEKTVDVGSKLRGSV